MTWPERLRNTLDTLFTSRLVLALRQQLEEVRNERDYFRGKCDKYEMMRDRPQVIGPRKPMPEGRFGRKPWREVMQEHIEKQNKKAEQDAKAKTQ